jgi:CTP:phosphocholine cytidylyltransferase-like protein
VKENYSKNKQKCYSLNEMPQIIHSLGKYDTENTRQRCLMSLKNGSASFVESLSSSASLYKIGNDNAGIYFSILNNSVGYFADYKKVQMSDLLVPSEHGIRQVLINSYSNMGPAKIGVGKLIFWNHLFPKFHCLMSDSQQTETGRAFWEYRIVEAFERNLTVRMVDTNDKTFVELSSIDDLHSLSSKVWGTQNWFQRIILIIISKTQSINQLGDKQ